MMKIVFRTSAHTSAIEARIFLFPQELGTVLGRFHTRLRESAALLGGLSGNGRFPLVRRQAGYSIQGLAQSEESEGLRTSYQFELLLRRSPPSAEVLRMVVQSAEVKDKHHPCRLSESLAEGKPDGDTGAESRYPNLRGSLTGA